jgi:hypothetical protein
MDYPTRYAVAERLYKTVSKLPDEEALAVVDLNKKSLENEDMIFVWDVVKCKIDAAAKRRLKK